MSGVTDPAGIEWECVTRKEDTLVKDHCNPLWSWTEAYWPNGSRTNHYVMFLHDSQEWVIGHTGTIIVANRLAGPFPDRDTAMVSFNLVIGA